MTLTLISGTVKAANARGLQLLGESDWRKFSRFADTTKCVYRADAGDRVIVSVDERGFVRAVESADPDGLVDAVEAAESKRQPEAAPIDADDLPIEPRPDYTKEAEPLPQPATGQVPDRDRQISRMAALNTAATVLGSSAREVKEADLMQLASRLERWINRPN